MINTVPALTVGDKVRVITRYSGSKTLLKEARWFESAAVLGIAAAQPAAAVVL